MARCRLLLCIALFAVYTCSQAKTLAKRKGCQECPLKIHCEYGFTVDADGCPTCTCKEEPVCEGLACNLWCEHGRKMGPDGCPTCFCN